METIRNIEAHMIGDHWSVFVDGVRAGFVEDDEKGAHVIKVDGKVVVHQSFTAAVRHLVREVPNDLYLVTE